MKDGTNSSENPTNTVSTKPKDAKNQKGKKLLVGSPFESNFGIKRETKKNINSLFQQVNEEIDSILKLARAQVPLNKNLVDETVDDFKMICASDKEDQSSSYTPQLADYRCSNCDCKCSFCSEKNHSPELIKHAYMLWNHHVGANDNNKNELMCPSPHMSANVDYGNRCPLCSHALIMKDTKYECADHALPASVATDHSENQSAALTSNWQINLAISNPFADYDDLSISRSESIKKFAPNSVVGTLTREFNLFDDEKTSGASTGLPEIDLQKETAQSCSVDKSISTPKPEPVPKVARIEVSASTPKSVIHKPKKSEEKVVQHTPDVSRVVLSPVERKSTPVVDDKVAEFLNRIEAASRATEKPVSSEPVKKTEEPPKVVTPVVEVTLPDLSSNFTKESVFSAEEKPAPVKQAVDYGHKLEDFFPQQEQQLQQEPQSSVSVQVPGQLETPVNTYISAEPARPDDRNLFESVVDQHEESVPVEPSVVETYQPIQEVVQEESVAPKSEPEHVVARPEGSQDSGAVVAHGDWNAHEPEYQPVVEYIQQSIEEQAQQSDENEPVNQQAEVQPEQVHSGEYYEAVETNQPAGQRIEVQPQDYAQQPVEAQPQEQVYQQAEEYSQPEVYEEQVVEENQPVEQPAEAQPEQVHADEYHATVEENQPVEQPVEEYSQPEVHEEQVVETNQPADQQVEVQPQDYVQQPVEAQPEQVQVEEYSQPEVYEEQVVETNQPVEQPVEVQPEQVHADEYHATVEANQPVEQPVEVPPGEQVQQTEYYQPVEQPREVSQYEQDEHAQVVDQPAEQESSVVEEQVASDSYEGASVNEEVENQPVAEYIQQPDEEQAQQGDENEPVNQQVETQPEEQVHQQVEEYSQPEVHEEQVVEENQPVEQPVETQPQDYVQQPVEAQPEQVQVEEYSQPEAYEEQVVEENQPVEQPVEAQPEQAQAEEYYEEANQPAAEEIDTISTDTDDLMKQFEFNEAEEVEKIKKKKKWWKRK